ncbi:MAG: NnrS family protein [Verrucomicrobiota bacterium JB022]|nr:NnrS family protein [Verrucomicrobiota bacterium JB022]
MMSPLPSQAIPAADSPTLPTIRWRDFAAACAAEPYRAFFPLGIVVGVVGVALWPLWYAGWVEAYPGPAHVRLMVEGFFTAFILGFLGTAGPRMLDARPLGLGEWGLVGGLWATGQVASLIGWANWAELGFVAAMMLFGLSLARRCGQREGLPPPGFVLVGLGSLGAVLGALTQMPWLQPHLPYAVWFLGRNFLIEAYILLPILGVAPFFLGRFGGLEPKHSPLDARKPDVRWRQQAGICLLLGAGIVGGIALQGAGLFRSGALLKAAFTAGFILTQVPWRYPRASTLARLAQASLLCLVLAPLAEAIWPELRIGLRHVLVITGFQWIVVCVGTWVAFAHAGRKQRLLRNWPLLWICAGGWALAMATRVVAEALPAIRDSHLIYAAAAWIVATLLWLALLLPRLREDG